MDEAKLAAAAQIASVLIPLAIQASEAIARAIQAVWGAELAPAEQEEVIAWIEQDSAWRAALAKADAGGGD